MDKRVFLVQHVFALPFLRRFSAHFPLIPCHLVAMNQPLLLIFLLTLLVGTWCQQIMKMTAQELRDIISSERRSEYQIIDVREKAELSATKLPTEGVVNLPMSLDKHWHLDVLDGKILDSTKPTVVICRTGGRSYRAAGFFCKPALSCFVMR